MYSEIGPRLPHNLKISSQGETVRIRYLIVFHAGLLICLHPWYANAITLEEVMTMASEQHPKLRIAEKSVDAAKGNLEEQGSYAYNPELSLEPQRRRLNAGGTSNDYYITLSQGIEIGGKRGYRELSAQAALSAANRELEATRQQLSIEAAKAFVDLFFAKQMLDMRSRQTAMLQQMSHAIDRRLEVGEANQLDANLARSTYASALNAETSAKQGFTLSQSRYYASVGQLGGDQPVNPELPKLLLDWRPPENPFEVALQSRPDLAGLRSQLTQSNAQADLAKAQRIPDPTLSVMNGREAGEQLILVGISIPIPIWNSHKGAYKAALAQSERTQTELEWSEHQLRLEVQAAIYNHESAMSAVASAYKAEEQQSAFDSIKLAQTAFQAGELDLEDLVIHINQGLDARLTALEIMKRGWLARIRLVEVLGQPEYILKGTEQ